MKNWRKKKTGGVGTSVIGWRAVLRWSRECVVWLSSPWSFRRVPSDICVPREVFRWRREGYHRCDVAWVRSFGMRSGHWYVPLEEDTLSIASMTILNKYDYQELHCIYLSIYRLYIQYIHQDFYYLVRSYYFEHTPLITIHGWKIPPPSNRHDTICSCRRNTVVAACIWKP